MTYLLDTNVFWWAATSPWNLSHKARRICEAPTARRLVSMRRELSGAVRRSETVTLGYPVEPVTYAFLG